ncbi:MAG: ABC-type bacteriocin/lantibiotic exporter with double-glycine peptidase domain [Desulforhopalus sp.]|jgi:ABC-type bacteriocin/lantibiotic exporter with double-glycine peptidase domain
MIPKKIKAMFYSDCPITKRPLFSWMKTAGLPLQLLLVMVIVITVCARVIPLEMQKRIINEAITLKNTDLLLIYCLIFVGAVIVASGLKFVITIIQTRIAQKVLVSLRKELYAHILTLPLSYFRKTPPGTLVSALVTEVAPTGELIGMALAVPLINILTFVAFLGYLLWLNWLLTLVAMSVYPFTMFIIPKLQQRSNKANKQRVRTTRELSGIITETITGIHEVHANGSFAIENNKYGAFVEKLFKIRITWNIYKQGAKIVSNFSNNFGPFLILLMGGYLTIHGRIDLGGLMAFLAANEKLFDPWKEIMEFYQVYQDASVRYKQTMEFLDERPEFDAFPTGRPVVKLEGGVTAENLDFTVEGNIRLLKNVDLSLKKGEHLALVGFSGSGKSTLARCLGQMYTPTGGKALIGGADVTTLSKFDVAYNVSVVSQSPYIFNGTIRENLHYSVNAINQSSVEGIEKIEPSLDEEIAILQQCGIFADVLRFGLGSLLNQEDVINFGPKIIRIRDTFREDFADQLGDKVEFFDETKFLKYLTVAENLIFASTDREDYKARSLSGNNEYLDFMGKEGMLAGFYALGANMARECIEKLGAQEADSSFYEMSPIEPEELKAVRSIERKLSRSGMDDLQDEDKKLLLSLVFSFIPGKHHLHSLPEATQFMIIEGRKAFRRMMSAQKDSHFIFYKRSEYLTDQAIMANILFGKLTSSDQEIQETFSQLLIQHLISEDILEEIMDIGLNFQVGSMGDKLSGGQKQKLAIARSFLKPTPVIIMDEATSALDNKSQARIQRLIESRWKGTNTLISVVHRLDIIKDFDKVAVMKSGEIVEVGPYDELMEKKGSLYQLVMGNS